MENPNVTEKKIQVKVGVGLKFEITCLGLFKYYPNLGSNNPACIYIYLHTYTYIHYI